MATTETIFWGDPTTSKTKPEYLSQTFQSIRYFSRAFCLAKTRFIEGSEFNILILGRRRYFVVRNKTKKNKSHQKNQDQFPHTLYSYRNFNKIQWKNKNYWII